MHTRALLHPCIVLHAMHTEVPKICAEGQLTALGSKPRINASTQSCGIVAVVIVARVCCGRGIVVRVYCGIVDVGMAVFVFIICCDRDVVAAVRDCGVAPAAFSKRLRSFRSSVSKGLATS